MVHIVVIPNILPPFSIQAVLLFGVEVVGAMTCGNRIVLLVAATRAIRWKTPEIAYGKPVKASVKRRLLFGTRPLDAVEQLGMESRKPGISIWPSKIH